MQNKTHVSPNRPLAMLLKLTHMLGLIVLGGMIVAVPVPRPSLLKRQIQKQEGSWVPRSIRATIRFPVPQ